MPFEEISLHYRGISPVNTAKRKYLCRQGQHCRAAKGGQRRICRRDRTDAGAESKGQGRPRFPAAPIPYGPSQPNLYTQGAAPHCHPPDLPKRRGGGAGPPRPRLEGIGTLTGITKRSWSQYRDLNWEGKQEHGAAASAVSFFWISDHLHGPASGRGRIFGRGWGGSSAAECSQSNLAGTRQGFSKRLVLQSESGRTLLFSEKCCPCLFFLMKANLVFSRSRPELFQTRKTADTNQ